VPIRLFGAVQYLALSGAAPNALSGHWEDLTGTFEAHAAVLRRRVETYGVQTNEVQRCTFLLPVLLAAARETRLPLELLELGPSAGLNLIADRYRYRFTEGDWGAPEARPELRARDEGRPVPAELLAGALDVRRRVGVDLSPVDGTSDEGYLQLRSFVWPGLDDRVERLDAAVETLRALPDPPELIAGDFVRALPERLAARPADALTVVIDTFASVFLPDAEAAVLAETLETGGADGRPLASVAVRRWDERSAPAQGLLVLELRIFPDPPRVAAHVDPHGNRLEWVLP
jgi:hypothetical protein